MVFNSMIVLTVAHVSANAWQQLSCIPLGERLSSHQLLDLVLCFPLQQLGRFALCLWTFLCLPPPDSFNYYPYNNSDSDDDDDDNASPSSTVDLDLDDYYYYHSHSD